MADATVVAVSGGVVAAVLTQLFGVDQQAVTAALLGGVLGLSAAPPASRFRAAAVFVCAVMGSAFIATWAAKAITSNEVSARNALAFLLAWLFHPLTQALVERIPKLLDSLIDRLKGTP